MLGNIGNIFLYRRTPCKSFFEFLQLIRKSKYGHLYFVGRDILWGIYLYLRKRAMFSLPARLGGLGFLDPMSMSDIEYECSLAATTQLTNAIFTQQRTLDIDRVALSETLKSVTDKKNSIHKQSLTQIKEESSEATIRILDLASEKGASSWLTALPLKRFGFLLNKQEFHDAICLRYVVLKFIM